MHPPITYNPASVVFVDAQVPLIHHPRIHPDSTHVFQLILRNWQQSAQWFTPLPQLGGARQQLEIWIQAASWLVLDELASS